MLDKGIILICSTIEIYNMSNEYNYRDTINIMFGIDKTDESIWEIHPGTKI